MRAEIAHHHGVTVGLGARHARGADRTAGAGHIFDHHLLAEHGPDRLSNQPRETAGRRARRERRHERNRPRRIAVLVVVLRVCAIDGWDGGGRNQQTNNCGGKRRKPAKCDHFSPGAETNSTLGRRETESMRRGARRNYTSRAIRRFFGKERWYSWVDSNHRPPDPQSGALNQLSYSCTACGFCFPHDLFQKPVSTFRDHAQARETWV